MCVPVQFVTRAVGGKITHIGGSTDDGRPWGLSEAEAVAAIDSGEWEYFVEVPKGQRTTVLTRYGPSGTKFLTTTPDDTKLNNLDSLPLRQFAIASVEPPFPLSIPGPPHLIGLLKLRKVETGINGVLTQLQLDPNIPQTVSREVFALDTQYWGVTPNWLYVTCRLPFPAIYEVFINKAQINGQIDPVNDQVEQIAGDDILRRRELELAGRGWFSWQLTLKKPDGSPDPSAPERFSEVQLVIRPHDDCWSHQWFRVYIRPSSFNRYCPGSATSLYFELSIPITPASVSRPDPAKAAVPNVTNLTLDVATTALSNAGFNKWQIIGPSLATNQLRVDAQTPKAGDSVPLTSTIWLSVSEVSVTSGNSKLTFHNASSRQVKLTIHSFDYATGQWKEEGDVDYDDTIDVDLTDGHSYGIYAVDPTLNGCRTGKPTEIDCVYWQPLSTFTGDDNGPAITVEIT